MKKIFTLCASALVAMSAYAGNHCVKLTQGKAKDNPWDVQVFLKLSGLEAGKAYTVEVNVKSGEAVTLGSESMDDVQQEHKDPYGNSAVFNYTDNLDVKTDWTTCTIHFPGKTDVSCSTEGHDKTDATHKGFEYAATALLLNVGKVAADLYIDNLVVKDESNNVVFSQDFENATIGAYDTSKDVHFYGWQNADWKIIEEEDTSLNTVKKASNAVMYNVLGQRVNNAKGLVIINGKKVIIK